METAELTTALIVDGFALSVTSAYLRDLFMAFGSVVRVRVVRDHCGYSLRYGYGVLDTESHALKAIEALSGKTLAGLPISVTLTAMPPLSPV